MSPLVQPPWAARLGAQVAVPVALEMRTSNRVIWPPTQRRPSPKSRPGISWFGPANSSDGLLAGSCEASKPRSSFPIDGEPVVNSRPPWPEEFWQPSLAPPKLPQGQIGPEPSPKQNGVPAPHSSGTPSPSPSMLVPSAMSRSSGMPLLLQSSAAVTYSSVW